MSSERGKRVELRKGFESCKKVSATKSRKSMRPRQPRHSEGRYMLFTVVPSELLQLQRTESPVTTPRSTTTPPPGTMAVRTVAVSRLPLTVTELTVVPAMDPGAASPASVLPVGHSPLLNRYSTIDALAPAISWSASDMRARVV